MQLPATDGTIAAGYGGDMTNRLRKGKRHSTGW